MSETRTALVVSAHSADFVWRAGGAIATHAERGYAVTVICLSYGERGESAKLWRLPGMTLDRVKAERQKEAEAAAKQLGVADIQFWDLGDYPITLSTESLYRLVDVHRAIHPAFVLSHSKNDIYNHDHPAVTDFAQHARILAQAHGHNPSVDAPFWARENFGIVIARSRMLPSVRPLMRQRAVAGLYGSSRVRSRSHRRARSTVDCTGSSNPVSPTVAPYSPSGRPTPLPSQRAYIAGTGARYSPPLTSRAQTMRAVLFASATVTSILGLRGNI